MTGGSPTLVLPVMNEITVLDNISSKLFHSATSSDVHFDETDAVSSEVSRSGPKVPGNQKSRRERINFLQVLHRQLTRFALHNFYARRRDKNEICPSLPRRQSRSDFSDELIRGKEYYEILSILRIIIRESETRKPLSVFLEIYLQPHLCFLPLSVCPRI